jgi:hypothetical protein
MNEKETVLVRSGYTWYRGRVIRIIQPREQFPVLYLIDFGGRRELVSKNRVRFN